MKRLERAKTIELIVFFALAAVCFYLIVMKSNVYHLIADSKELQLVCMLLWISLFTGFLFVFIDFSLYSKQKSTMNALDYAAHSDALAKIANRQGIDDLIEKYVDKTLPPNMGCAFFLLTSLNEINQHSRTLGNEQIRSFSIILKLASTGVCFVGRNGGNVFMAIFEDTTQEKIDHFMERIKGKTIEYNNNINVPPMYYQCGVAFHEDESVKSINSLISLSSKRARDAKPIPNSVRSIDAFISKKNKKETSVEEIKEETVAKDIKENSNKTETNDSSTVEPTKKKITQNNKKVTKKKVANDYRYSIDELNGLNENYLDYLKG